MELEKFDVRPRGETVATNSTKELRFIYRDGYKIRDFGREIDTLDSVNDRIMNILEMQHELNNRYEQQIRNLQQRQEHSFYGLVFSIVPVCALVVIIVVGTLAR